jgi:GDP-4-dehydro-6-deoxy-D-mannose reductase
MSIPSRILITGCTGFVGSHLVEHCRKRYPQAEMFGITGHQTFQTGTPGMSDVKIWVVDIRQPEAIHQVVAMSHPDLIIHLAAQSSVSESWKDPFGTLEINAGGVIQLFEAVRSEQLTPRIVLVGSGEQYGMVHPEDIPIREQCPFRPANPYAVSKVTQDLYGYQYYVAYGLPIMRARPFNHFGPRQTSTFVIANFAQQIALIEAERTEPVLSIGNLEVWRDFLPVEDVVAAYLAIAEQGQPGEAYNIGSGHARSIREILDILLAFARVPIQLREDPARLRPIDVPLLEADTSRLRTDTNWKPVVQFEFALQQTLDFWRTVVSTEHHEQK